MANSYIHGAYGHIGESRSQPATKVTTAPVYIGTAPVHVLADYASKVNIPIRITSYADAVRKIGYSDDWKNYSLCEAIDAHFRNQIENVGPIYVINVLDPATMRAAIPQSANVNLIGGKGMLLEEKAIRESISIQGKTENVDYFLDYDPGKKGYLITDIGGSLSSPLNVSYTAVDPSQVDASTVEGGITTAGEATGIYAVRYVYQDFNIVPTILAAPGWSHIQSVGETLKSVANQINGHWYAFVYEDLPAESAVRHGIEKIATVKQQMGYNNYNAKAHWPRALKNGKIYHLSTLGVVRAMQTDQEHNGIPYETGSNKPIDVNALCFEDGTVLKYDQEQANSLNAVGITTAIYWGGRFVLWGPHTENFFYNSDNDIRGIFEPYVRMLFFIANSFQLREGPEVDRPMDRRLKDSILLRWRSRLDGYVSLGALLYSDVQFRPEDNITSDLIQGDFMFDIEVTATPPAKSISARVSWTDKGMSAYFEDLES